MILNYFKIAWRNLIKNKVYSFLNIAGLSVGMAVALIISLWIWDELNFDKYHTNYDRIAQVEQHLTNNGEMATWQTVPFPLADELRNKYGSDFKYIVLTGGGGNHILSLGEKSLLKNGVYMEPDGPELFTLNMFKGTRSGLKDPSSVLLSQSAATAYFGDADPINKVMKIDNKQDVLVTGVFEDLPANSTLANVQFIAPWSLLYANSPWLKTADDPWRPNSFVIYTQLAEHAEMDKISIKIKDAKLNKISKELARKRPALFLLPMSKWHLSSEFKNGVNTGGRIKYVWLFGIIGIFVLLLACINFMNLGTARSEKRAKEVGIRKSIGSLKKQLIFQFFIESLLLVFISFIVAFFLVLLVLPFFNEVANKKVSILWASPWFWLSGILFSLLTGIIAGSYPAFYLSSFEPIKILKGTFRVGRYAALPRKILVVLQFSVSVTMIIGTIVVFRQIQFIKDRPVGYESNGVVALPIMTADIHQHINAVKEALQNKGIVLSMAEASSPPTEIWSSTSGIDWSGKDPNLAVDFSAVNVSYDYGKTIDWKIIAGRDFSKAFLSDSSGLILNESAIKFVSLKNPVGETILWFGTPFKILGVVKDMVMQSPYEPSRPTIFSLSTDPPSMILAKINPSVSAHTAIEEIEIVFKKFNPSQPFTYQFMDQEYNKKFGNEERIGRLAGFFAILAVFISCLGLFGMASFIAEQRTKEIGVRKVLGATIINVWQMLSGDFILLVLIALFIAIPVAWYGMHQWLQNYTYHTQVSWWIFAVAGFGALGITLLTVSFQAIKAALMNPVKSLKSE